MKSTFMLFKLPMLVILLALITQTAQSQTYYTPPGRDEALLIGSSKEGRDFNNPIDTGPILGPFVYTDARNIGEYYPFYHSTARGVSYRFTLKYPSTVIIDQVGSETVQNMTINLINRFPWVELKNDWDGNINSLPQEYLSHPFILASGEDWWKVFYKQTLEPGEYYIASNGGYGNGGGYGGIVVTNLHITPHKTDEGDFESPYYIGSFERGFEFSDRIDVANQQSVYGNDTPDVVYAFEIKNTLKLTVTTKGSEFPGSNIYILDEGQRPAKGQNIAVNADGFVTVTINNLRPGYYYVVSEAGGYSGELQTTIKGYIAPPSSDESGPMPEYDPSREILQEPENNKPIRYQYDATGNRHERKIYWH